MDINNNGWWRAMIGTFLICFYEGTMDGISALAMYVGLIRFFY